MNSSTKNQDAFLKDFSSNPELAKAVLDQMGEDFSQIIEFPYDYRDAGAGVSGFIYYNETLEFAEKNTYQILKSLNEFENECGQLDKPTDDETQYFNWLAWFALETTIQDIINYVED